MKGTQKVGRERKETYKNKMKRKYVENRSTEKRYGWKMAALSVCFIKHCLACLQIRDPSSTELKLMNDCHIELQRYGMLDRKLV